MNLPIVSAPSLPAAEGLTGKAGALTRAPGEGQPSFAKVFTMLVAPPVETASTEAAAAQPDAVTPQPAATSRRAGRTNKSDVVSDAIPIIAGALAAPVPATANGASPEISEAKPASAVTSPPTSALQPIGLAASKPGHAETQQPTIPAQAAEHEKSPPEASAGVANAGLLLPDTEAPTVLPVPQLIAAQTVASAGAHEREPEVAKDSSVPAAASANAVETPRSQPAPHAAPASPAPPLADQIHAQIAGHMDQLQQVGRVEAQLNLHPPELGRVQVHVAFEDGRLNVRMVVQDENAKRLIDQQIEPLRVRFAEMGVSVGQFDVRRDGASANPEQRQSAEPSAQPLQANSTAAAGAQKSYAKFANADALVDVIA